MKRMSPRNDNNMPCYLTQDVIDGGQDTRILKGNKDSYILDYSFANKKHTQTYMNHAMRLHGVLILKHVILLIIFQ